MLDAPALRQILARLTLLPSHDPTDDLVRLIVQARARDACEYCLMPTRSLFHVDHIVPSARWAEYLEAERLIEQPVSDRGASHIDNFAWACPHCNTSKGDRIQGRVGQRMSRLFHPRRDLWNEHFVLTGGHLLIEGVTDIGKATKHVLGFNRPHRNGAIVARHKAILDGVYPPPWAKGWGY